MPSRKKNKKQKTMLILLQLLLHKNFSTACNLLWKQKSIYLMQKFFSILAQRKVDAETNWKKFSNRKIRSELY